MTDFEQRLHDALVSAGEQAPSLDPQVAPGARVRARRRRRTTAGAALATVLAVIAVPAAVLLTQGRDGDRPSPAVATDSSAPVPSGWRVETWRDVTVRVPADWGYGALDQWCADAGDEAAAPVTGGPGVVQRPEGGQTQVLCSPRLGFGVRFVDPAEISKEFGAPPDGRLHVTEAGDPVFPAGIRFAFRPRDAHAAIEVVAPDRVTAERILSSAVQADLDVNGCWTSPGRGDGPPRTKAPKGQVTLCRYGPDGWLQQSERLSLVGSRAALKAIQEAPLRTAPTECEGGPRLSTSIDLISDQALAPFTVVWEAECPGDNGVFLSGAAKELTPDVLYWALSPGWSGGWDPQAVPMPKEFRRLPPG